MSCKYRGTMDCCKSCSSRDMLHKVCYEDSASIDVIVECDMMDFDVSCLSRSGAVEFVGHKCNYCIRRYECTGANAKVCNKKVEYLLNKFRVSNS